MKQYSFLNESKSFVDFCTEEDCEMIPFVKVSYDIKNSVNEDDITADIRNAIDSLKKWTKSEDFKKIPSLKQKFLLEILDVFIDHVKHLMCLDCWCGYIDKERWIKCFAPDYVKHVVNSIKKDHIV